MAIEETGVRVSDELEIDVGRVRVIVFDSEVFFEPGVVDWDDGFVDGVEVVEFGRREVDFRVDIVANEGIEGVDSFLEVFLEGMDEEKIRCNTSHSHFGCNVRSWGW